MPSFNQMGSCPSIDPPKSLSQVVVSVVHVEFKLTLTSLQELVVAQSMTWPGNLSVVTLICWKIAALSVPEFCQLV